MRRVIYAVAMSLDGYIAGPNGEFDWIVMDPDIDFAAMFSRFDTLLMGRVSYEAACKQGQGAMPGMTSYVFSRTLRQTDCVDATVSNSPADVISALKTGNGKDIWLFGGGSLFRSLLQLGLVDGVQVAIIPVLIGGGLPMLPPVEGRWSLTLTKHTVYEKSGIVLCDYDVVPA